MPALAPKRARLLTDARLELHVAAQVASALGTTLLPAEADHGHTSLTWDTDIGGLVGRPVQGVQAALLFGPLRWQLWRDGAVLAELDAEGQGLDDGLAWLRTAAAAHGLADRAMAPDAAYTLPADAPVDGPLGRAPAQDRAQLAAWFSLAHAVLTDRLTALPGASPLRCWPHHFDLDLLVSLDGATGEEARSVGVGLSPGDAGIDQPYLSVRPWPAPAARAGPDLPVGSWHTEGWFGAVLQGKAVPAQDPRGTLERFLDAAVPAARALAGG